MSEKVKRQPKTGYRPSLWTRIAKTLRGKKVNRGIADNIFTALFLLIMGAFMALPLLYVILNAFKPMEELLLFPPKFLVYNPTLRNFSDLFSLMGETWVPFSRYVANTVFITATATFFHIAFHNYDPKTDLYRHACDVSKREKWADKTTGWSQHCWGRAMGSVSYTHLDRIPI